MKRWLLLPSLVFSLVMSAAEVRELEVASQTMETNVPVSVVLPDGYTVDSPVKWPVVYCLHGANGDNKTHSGKDVQRYADKFGMIVVAPDGGKTSWWLDSPIDPRSQYETFIVDELVPYIDKMFLTIADRSKRAIMGGSMGGHGACRLGFRHSDLFGAVGNIFGGVDLWEFPQRWDIKKRLGERDEHPEVWRNFSAISDASRLQNGEVELITIIGTSDFFLEANRRMHEVLISNKVEHVYIECRTGDERSSGHSGEFFGRAQPVVLNFIRNYFDTGKGQLAVP